MRKTPSEEKASGEKIDEMLKQKKAENVAVPREYIARPQFIRVGCRRGKEMVGRYSRTRQEGLN